MKTFAILGAIFGFLGVMFGAFGGHALKSRLPFEQLMIFEVGVRYQMYHVFALLFVAWAATQSASTWIHASGWMFSAGIVLFSGSLYILALSGIRAFGIITPFGGLLFLAGWASLVVGMIK